MTQEATIRSKESLRLWLRMLPIASLVETELRNRFKENFSMSLAQFDVLAELERAEAPQTMSELSRKLLVSGGHVTGVVDKLTGLGYVVRRPAEDDRRVQLVALTDEGRTAFEHLAAQHEEWINEFFANIPLEDIQLLNQLLARAKSAVNAAFHRQPVIKRDDHDISADTEQLMASAAPPSSS